MNTKSTVKKFCLGILTIALCGMALTGCSWSGEPSSAGNGSKAAVGVKTIRVGSGSTYIPYCYLDKSGDRQGFEYELLKLIQEKVPDVKFEYESAYFANLMLSLESGQLDMVAHQVSRNAERDKKFLFSDSYVKGSSMLTVAGNRNDINSLEDLQGKTILLGPTEITKDVVEAFNVNHKDNPINVKYKDGNTDAYAMVATGKVDACVGTPAVVWATAKEGKMDIKVVGKELGNNSKVYYAFRKDESLQPYIIEINNAIKELKDSGKLAELSKQYLGGDYT